MIYMCKKCTDGLVILYCDVVMYFRSRALFLCPDKNLPARSGQARGLCPVVELSRNGGHYCYTSHTQLSAAAASEM